MKFLKLIVLGIPLSFVYGTLWAPFLWAQSVGFNAVERSSRSTNSVPKTSEPAEQAAPEQAPPEPVSAEEAPPEPAPATTTTPELTAEPQSSPTASTPAESPEPASAEPAPAEPAPPAVTSTSNEPTPEATTESVSQESVSSGAGNSYPAVYKTGETPFQEKTKIKIRKSGDAFLFIPEKGEAWSLPINDIRGAVTSPKGLWFYWFDEGGNTLSGYFKMDDGNTYLAGEINDAVREYRQRPALEMDQYKAKYEEYKTEAIKDAR